MVDDGIIGEDPAIRIAAGGGDWPEGRELAHTAREASSTVAVREVGPVGVSGFEPLVLATLDGETAFFPDCRIDRVRSIAERLADGTLPTENAMTTVTHESGTLTFPVPEKGPLGVGERAVTRSCGWAVPGSVADYRAAGPFVASDVDEPEEIVSKLASADLRGRGRGDGATDTPIAAEWQRASETDGDPVIVVNANEADPHATMDRSLLESDPLAVLDAALAAGRALGATNVVVYLGTGDTLARERVSETVAAIESELEPEAPIEVVAGPDEYKAGEMTMAIEALEGNHRLEARLRPPFPSEEGLHGRPTLVHTPRTLMQVNELLGHDDGSSSDPGTRLFSVVGNGASPATVELSIDDDIESAREAIGFDGRLKAACVGGVFGGITRTLDVPARADALLAAGLGTNGVIELFDDEQCIVSLAGNRAVFGEEENCGRCVPCREGTTQLTELLREVYHGEYESEKIRELTRVMTSTSICSFGQEASRPVRTAMDEFEAEFRAHAEGRCPAGACK